MASSVKGVRVAVQMLPPSYENFSESCTLIYVSGGSCRLYMAEESALIEEKDCVLLRAGVSWRLEGYCSLTAVQFPGEKLFGSFMSVLGGNAVLSSFFLSNANRNPAYLSFPDCNEAVCSAFDGLLEEYRKMQTGYMDIIACELTGLLLRLARSCRDAGHSREKSDSERTEKAIDYLLRHYKTVTLADLSAEMNYHPNTVSALLKNGTGKTFSELVSEIRMDRASALLLQGKTVRQTAETIGYRNLTHFYKQFSARFGMKPAEYVNKCRE